MTGRRVLADTSAWIEWLKGAPHAVSEKMESLMDDDRLCVAAVIKAELMRGAASDHELKDIDEYWDNLPSLIADDLIWDEAGSLAYRLRRKGITAGLIDCYLAALAISNDVSLMTLDKGFEPIRQHSTLRLVAFE